MSTLDTHPDFGQLVGITADRIGILPAIVRKDYWVTRVLRAIASDGTLRRQVIFKGGTSLSKGWRLIDRFSEDIDLLTTGPDFSDIPGKKACEKIFKAIRSRVESETPLRLPELQPLPWEEQRFLYFRSEYHCDIRYPLPGMAIRRTSAFTDFVFMEMGFRGGSHPHEAVSLNSFVGETILGLAEGQRSALAAFAEDFTPFELELLNPTRTIVEKLLALHSALANGIENVRTRHYYDVATVFTKSPEVKAFLQSKEFPDLVRSAVDVTIQFFDSSLDPNLNLASSPALNLTPEQIRVLAAQYENENQRGYYFAGQPPFEDVVRVIAEIRQLLQSARL